MCSFATYQCLHKDTTKLQYAYENAKVLTNNIANSLIISHERYVRLINWFCSIRIHFTNIYATYGPYFKTTSINRPLRKILYAVDALLRKYESFLTEIKIATLAEPSYSPVRTNLQVVQALNGQFNTANNIIKNSFTVVIQECSNHDQELPLC